jgi:hypothetical protein
MAEREGLPLSFNKHNKIKVLLPTRTQRVYQPCVPESTDFWLLPRRVSAEAPLGVHWCRSRT